MIERVSDAIRRFRLMQAGAPFEQAKGRLVQRDSFLSRELADLLLEASIESSQRQLADLTHSGLIVTQWVSRGNVGARSGGLTDVNDKRNLDIVQQDRDGSTLRRWSLSRAWPTKFVAGEWDNESDENVIESVTLTYDFFELVQ